MSLPVIHPPSSAHLIEQRLSAHPVYICPACAGPLDAAAGALDCRACGIRYPLQRGIPDFVRDDPARPTPKAPPLAMGVIRAVVNIYESRFWYTPFLRAVGGRGAPDFNRLAEIMRGKADFPERATILDAACGPATWGRRIATPERAVYGIDLIWPMLFRGLDLLAEGHIENVHLAHCAVEKLPFRDAWFDGAICGGALHIFPDPVAALAEIGRTMKPGARLVVMTFLKGSKWQEMFNRLSAQRGLHYFELDELRADLDQAGFERFEPETHGAVAVFTAERRAQS